MAAAVNKHSLGKRRQRGNLEIPYKDGCFLTRIEVRKEEEALISFLW